MINREKIMKIYDSAGNMAGVMVPADVWTEIEALLEPEPEKSDGQPEDISGFEELMQAWNFRYPYDPAVRCPDCGSQTPDWRSGGPGVFNLVSANLGGLLVFHCANCGSTIRHKYFKDHMALESSGSSGHHS